jgi:hypothetical protein
MPMPHLCDSLLEHYIAMIKFRRHVLVQAATTEFAMCLAFGAVVSIDNLLVCGRSHNFWLVDVL